MPFPLSLWDISLWLGFTSIILTITSEILSPRYGKVKIYINRKRLQKATQLVSTFFLITVALKIISIISL